MAITEWMDRRIARLNWMDIGLLKICVMAFVLMVAKLWPPLLMPDWKVFGAIFLITYAPLFIKLVVRKDGHS